MSKGCKNQTREVAYQVAELNLLLLFQHITALALCYVDTLLAALDAPPSADQSKKSSKNDEFISSIERRGEFLCNANFIFEKLTVLCDEFFKLAHSKDEAAAELILKFCRSHIETTQLTIKDRADTAVDNLKRDLRSCLGAIIKEQLPQFAKKQNAFDELFAFLDQILTNFFDAMLESDFDVVLGIVWTELITILKFSVDKAITVSEGGSAQRRRGFEKEQG